MKRRNPANRSFTLIELLVVIAIIAILAGKVDEVVAAYLKGELSVNPDFRCHHHDGDAGHKCGEHHCGNGHCY